MTDSGGSSYTSIKDDQKVQCPELEGVVLLTETVSLNREQKEEEIETKSVEIDTRVLGGL